MPTLGVDPIGLEGQYWNTKIEGIPCVLFVVEYPLVGNRYGSTITPVAGHVTYAYDNGKGQMLFAEDGYDRYGLGPTAKKLHTRVRVFQCCCLTDEENRRVLQRVMEVQKLADEFKRNLDRGESSSFPTPAGQARIVSPTLGPTCAHLANYVGGGLRGLPQWGLLSPDDLQTRYPQIRDPRFSPRYFLGDLTSSKCKEVGAGEAVVRAGFSVPPAAP